MTTPEPAPRPAVAVGHRGRGELMLGQDSGDAVMEVRGVVEILDIGTVDTEHVVDADGRKLVDDVVDHALLPVHLDHLSSPP